jgi:hypothetical protein
MVRGPDVIDALVQPEAVIASHANEAATRMVRPAASPAADPAFRMADMECMTILSFVHTANCGRLPPARRSVRSLEI